MKLWNTPLMENEKIIELPVNQRTITRRYTDKADEFVTANKDKPFFLYLPHSMPHIPLFVPEDVLDPDPKNAYTCVIEHIDAEVGNLEGLRQGDWKLLIKQPKARRSATKTSIPKPNILLFNLSDDIGETANLAAKHPEKVKAMRARMKKLDDKLTSNARPVWRKK